MASYVLLPEQKVWDPAIRRRRNPTWRLPALQLSSFPVFQLSSARAAARKHRSSATGTSRAFGRTPWARLFYRFGCKALLVDDDDGHRWSIISITIVQCFMISSHIAGPIEMIIHRFACWHTS